MSEGSDVTQGKFTTTLVLSPGGGTEPVATSAITKTSSSKTTITKTTKITKSSSSSTGGSSSSTTTTTTTESSSTGADGQTTRTMNTVTTKSSSNNFADGLADRFAVTGNIDTNELQRIVQEEMAKMKTQTLQLMPSSPAAPNTGDGSVVQLDQKSIMDYVDKSNNNMLAFNFDMNNYASETINVKTVGNKVEVNACRTTKSSDGSQTKEEFSRSYEMPTSGVLDADKVTSGLYNDGVLTIQLPLSEALQ